MAGRTQATFSKIVEQIHKISAEGVEEELQKIGQEAVNMSPVDTGAFVTSFSFVPAGSGGGRARSSSGKPRRQNVEEKRQEGYSQLLSDISGLNIEDDLKNSTARYTLKNRAPHAVYIEHGHLKTGIAPSKIFARLSSRFGGS